MLLGTTAACCFLPELDVKACNVRKMDAKTMLSYYVSCGKFGTVKSLAVQLDADVNLLVRRRTGLQLARGR